MATVVILTAKGELKHAKIPTEASASILTLDHLMAILKRKTQPEELCSYKYKKLQLTFFGYESGRAGTETKHTLPPPNNDETYYGDIVVVASKKSEDWSKPVSFSTKDYDEFYEERMNRDSEGENDDDDDDTETTSETFEEEDEESIIEDVDDVKGVEDEDDAESEEDESDEEDEDEDGLGSAEGGDEDGFAEGADDDAATDIVVKKPKAKKKSVSTSSANTARGKQYILLQRK